MTRDECEHGSLRRSCEICERDRRIEQLDDAIRAAAHDSAIQIGVTRNALSNCASVMRDGDKTIANLRATIEERDREISRLTSACQSCIWANGTGDGPCDHCEDGSADQYDAYPRAHYTCSGYKHHQLDAREKDDKIAALRAEVAELKRRRNLDLDDYHDAYLRCETRAKAAEAREAELRAVIAGVTRARDAWHKLVEALPDGDYRDARADSLREIDRALTPASAAPTSEEGTSNGTVDNRAMDRETQGAPRHGDRNRPDGVS